MNLYFSIIIPVYNRPDELNELLLSIVSQQYNDNFEVIVVEDGSDLTSKVVVDNFKETLNINYFVKENSGPGLSRNFGMQKAEGNYFIILDSDCILPKHYLTTVSQTLIKNFTDAFGGADAAHTSFTVIQKAINYAMTSVLTTGGLRGNKNLRKFQPRSFNMGISKIAFEKTEGFSALRYGEDINLAFKLWDNNLETQFIEEAYVYHKRRVNWSSFFKQTFNFGAARPILNVLHPNSAKITYWFPSIFMIGLLLAIIGFFFNFNWLLNFYFVYTLLIFVDSLFGNKNLQVALISVLATFIMFSGYGFGFLRSMYRLAVLSKTTEVSFPEMFRE